MVLLVVSTVLIAGYLMMLNPQIILAENAPQLISPPPPSPSPPPPPSPSPPPAAAEEEHEEGESSVLSVARAVAGEATTSFLDELSEGIEEGVQEEDEMPEMLQDVLPDEFQSLMKTARFCATTPERCKTVLSDSTIWALVQLVQLLSWLHSHPEVLVLLVLFPFAGRAKDFVFELRDSIFSWMQEFVGRLCPKVSMSEKWKATWVNFALSGAVTLQGSRLAKNGDRGAV